MKLGLAVGLLTLLATCGQDGVGPQPTPSAISTDPYYVAATERIALYATCLQDKGFDVQHSQDQGTLERIPDEQREAFERAADVCWEDAIARYPQAPPPSEEELRELNLESAECLEAEGYTVSEPPTEEAWLEAWPERVIWFPWGEVPNVNPEEWTRLNRVCVVPGTR